MHQVRTSSFHNMLLLLASSEHVLKIKLVRLEIVHQIYQNELQFESIRALVNQIESILEIVTKPYSLVAKTKSISGENMGSTSIRRLPHRHVLGFFRCIRQEKSTVY